ncbi:MAG: YebC/PmpR family DNA-binding transcriptional regulator [Bacteroidetes bacterium]|uniref:YebC/PmpR family DNA-binding transcriptional regulator n=1 Tax=Flavobacterium filum TaxID=370974 RepID=UPI0023EFCDC3|nr:YebC/PmpR family DNA-binding transcriptional regulator [Flavobacterium filum]MCA0429365.1 YebC/PmpR family DNA-binding transcriptional regulator [Bacteroidota bacterium]
MGRIFETRKATMFKRYAKMAKAFTKIGRDIVMAVKTGGPNPESNPRLRLIMQNAKAVNMPKANVESAIKRASDKDTSNYEEVIYEGYAPHGVPVLVECTTNNPTRTVASVRMYFSRAEGALGTNGSVSFMFERKAIFKIEATNLNKDDLELELIDFGLEEINLDEEHQQFIIQTAFTDYGNMATALEDKKINVIESAKIFSPTTFKELSEEQEKEVMAMIEKMEDDEDVVAVYHNLS